MYHAVQRLGFKLSRGAAVLLLIIGAAVAAAFWIGPFRPLPANLNLYVSNGTMAGPNEVFIAPKSRPGAARARFPLVLAASNNGARAASPTRLSLSIPVTYRLVRGIHAITPDLTSGNPLAHYTVDLGPIALPADSALYTILTDTLWLEPNIRDYDCTTVSDSIPEFGPPAAVSASSMSRVPIFYSFDGTVERQTGMFTAALDSSVLQRATTATPPEFPMYVREPEAPRPEMGELKQVGTRTTLCGDPQDPLELYTVDWETSGGGRFLVVYLNGAPRKHLFDLDRDSIIELEMWDANNDGRFEAWRQASFAIPTMLLPERLPLEVEANDSSLNDPRWLVTFEDTATGPFRFLADSARTRRIPPVAVDTMRADTGAVAVTPIGSPAVTPTGSPAVIAIDTAWVRKFNNPAAGPYRFLQNPPALRAGPPRDTTPARPRPPQRPRGPQPLGVPVPSGRGR